MSSPNGTWWTRRTEVGVEILIFYFCSVFVQSSRKDFQWNTFILKVLMNFHYERKLDDPWVDLLFLISYNDCIVLYSVTVVQWLCIVTHRLWVTVFIHCKKESSSEHCLINVKRFEYVEWIHHSVCNWFQWLVKYTRVHHDHESWFQISV